MSDKLPSRPQGKAAVFNGHGQPFEFITRELPLLKPGEILVKTLYTTICGSDIHTYCGRRMEPPNVVLGHEIVGDILSIGPGHPATDLRGAQIAVGDRITWSIFSVPEGIAAPRMDMPQKSEQLFKYGHALAHGDDVFNGGLADYCILRNHTALIKISPSIPLKVAATISCAHSTVAGAIRTAGVIADKRILIFGVGLLGLSCAAMCREIGASSVSVIDNDSNRLTWGELFGADGSWLFPAGNLSVLPWPEADIVFDMTGNPQAMELGLVSLALGGCAVWIGAVYPESEVRMDAQRIVRKLLHVRGLHNYNYEDFLNAAVFIENNYKKYPFESLVEKEYDLDHVEEAFHFAANNKPVRVGIIIKG